MHSDDQGAAAQKLRMLRVRPQRWPELRLQVGLWRRLVLAQLGQGPALGLAELEWARVDRGAPAEGYTAVISDTQDVCYNLDIWYNLGIVRCFIGHM